MDDVPKSPVLVAELIGHFMAAGALSFGLGELVSAVKDAGAVGAGEKQEDDPEDPPLVDAEKAAPMVLVVAKAIKVRTVYRTVVWLRGVVRCVWG